jgi:CheY-like chemotaxis protein
MQTVLIVDDEFGVAEVLQSILEDEGYRVVTAINGKQGMVRLAEVAPDLVMLDYMMPIMDGTKTLQAIRQQEGGADLPVIMMSSLDEATVRDTTTLYTQFLRKPFRAAHVVALVAKLLAHRKSTS